MVLLDRITYRGLDFFTALWVSCNSRHFELKKIIGQMGDFFAESLGGRRRLYLRVSLLFVGRIVFFERGNMEEKHCVPSDAVGTSNGARDRTGGNRF